MGSLNTDGRGNGRGCEGGVQQYLDGEYVVSESLALPRMIE